MSDYVKSTNFAAKDALSSGNPSKIVKGTEIDTEFNNIAIAVATKADSSGATLTSTTLTSATLNSPTLVTPVLGTPSSGTLTSCTGLPLTTGVTGTLPVANGGTGATSITSGSLVKGNGTSAFSAASASDIVTAIGSTAVQNATNATNATTAANGGVTSVDSQTGAITLSSLTAFGNSLSQRGYQKLPGGLIIQWGRDNTGASVTFPIAFPNACFSVVGSPSTNVEEYTSSITTTGFYFGSNTGGMFVSCWIAIGY